MLRGLTPRSPSRARSATPSCPAICPSSNAGANYPIPSASATSRRIAVAAMSNSTWSSTAARCSGCNRAAARNRSCCPCPRLRSGVTIGSRKRAPPKPSSPPT
ncbi:hypothetical protein G6F35_018679 [Rhizopus arrhizus]|nr:hypothetical protein G6F31_021084 [Rhizopus arrhizus]KAG1165620.1 hypothetical protein G6F35_018679 [Rhizopus arrhizus]